MTNTSYSDQYRDTDFRERPDLYRIGRGEQGVLLAEPYKSEILPHWAFRTEPIAAESAAKILSMFYAYLADGEFVGADMARKFLQMGWTRARRYANHADGNKYDGDGKVRPQARDAMVNEKARAAKIFKQAYDEARAHEPYLEAKRIHREKYETG